MFKNSLDSRHNSREYIEKKEKSIAEKEVVGPQISKLVETKNMYKMLRMKVEYYSVFEAQKFGREIAKEKKKQLLQRF